MKPAPGRLYGLIGLMTLIWSLNYIAAKLVLVSFPPLLVGPLRAALAAVLLVPIYAWSRARAPREPWQWRDLGALALLGVCGITLNQVFFVIGLQTTSVAHAALIIASTPLQVLGLAALRGQERITKRKLTGLFTAVGGILMLQLDAMHAAKASSWVGDAFVLLASFTFALYTVFGKEITRRHDSLTVNSIGYFAGALAGAPLVLQQSWGFHYEAVTTTSWWALLYMGALSSMLCYFIYYYALNHLPASRVAAFSYAQPVIASTAGLLLLHEPVTPAIIGGGLLVLGGVWFTGRG